MRAKSTIWAVGAASTAIGTALVASTLTASAATVTVHRLSGGDRYATAAAAFAPGERFGCQAGDTTTNTNTGGVALLARGDAYADALAGSFLAARLNSEQGTGILLTQATSLTTPAAALNGINTVYVRGAPVRSQPGSRPA